MEDEDDDAEMADYGTDFSDDVDPNFDAEGVLVLRSAVPPRASPAARCVEGLRVYELIINSPSCRLQYGRLLYVALAFLGRQASNAASEGCHSTGQLVISDKQTTVSCSSLAAACCLSRTLNRSCMLPVRALA